MYKLLDLSPEYGGAGTIRTDKVVHIVASKVLDKMHKNVFNIFDFFFPKLHEMNEKSSVTVSAALVALFNCCSVDCYGGLLRVPYSDKSEVVSVRELREWRRSLHYFRKEYQGLSRPDFYKRYRYDYETSVNDKSTLEEPKMQDLIKANNARKDEKFVMPFISRFINGAWTKPPVKEEKKKIERKGVYTVAFSPIPIRVSVVVFASPLIVCATICARPRVDVTVAVVRNSAMVDKGLTSPCVLKDKKRTADEHNLWGFFFPKSNSDGRLFCGIRKAMSLRRRSKKEKKKRKVLFGFMMRLKERIVKNRKRNFKNSWLRSGYQIKKLRLVPRREPKRGVRFKSLGFHSFVRNFFIKKIKLKIRPISQQKASRNPILGFYFSGIKRFLLLIRRCFFIYRRLLKDRDKIT